MTTAASEPAVGQSLGPNRVEITGALIRSYLNSTGDQGFAAHAAAIKLATGLNIAPPTILDRDVGARLVTGTYAGGYALHAKQSFSFKRALERDCEYTIEGRVVDVFTKNEVGYFTVDTTCRAENGDLAFSASYTRAFRFPGNRNPDRKPARPRPAAAAYLDEHGARTAAVFPEAGSVLEGAPRQITRSLMNLYSGPGANAHTDVAIARRAGNADTIVQGLMATSLECELYREVFGPAWYSGGEISVSFIRPILAESVLTPVAVVVGDAGGRIEFRTAVFDQNHELVTVGNVRCTLDG